MWKLAALLLGLGLLALALIWFRGPQSTVVPERSLAIDPTPSVALPTETLTGDREPVGEPSVLSGTVRDESGAPVSGASVRWSCIEREDLDKNPSWAIDSLSPAPRASAEAITDVGGGFEFAAQPCATIQYGSFVAASAPGFVPQGKLVEDKQAHLALVLSRGPQVSVRVTDVRGTPVAGATVSHFDSDSRFGGRLRPVEERSLSQKALTGPDGRVTLAAFAGEQTFIATHGQLSSVPWQGSRPASVELVLVPTFSVEGSVSYPDREQWAPEVEGERRIEVACREGGIWRVIAVQRNIESEFHLANVPIAGRASTYRVRLEGAPVLTDDKFFARPREGDRLEFTFSAVQGTEAYLYVDDEAGKPIATATAQVSWEVDGVASRQAFGASRSDGYISLRIPPGQVQIQVEAPGYSTFFDTQILPVQGGLWVTLQRSNSVRGVCRQEGEPIENFELIYCKTELMEMRGVRAVRNAQGGNFELALGEGTWLIQAASSTHPACKPVVVNVPSTDSDSIELDLTAPLLGGGTVLDADRGEPVGDAVVQAYTGDGRDRSLRWGEPTLTAADGSFELTAFVRGNNTITVRAPGFAEAVVTKSSNVDGLVEWGEIRLVRPQDLDLAIRGFDESPFGATAWWAYTAQGFMLPKRNFDSEGRMVFTDVPPGEHRVLVQDHESAYARLHLALKPGDDWNYSVGVGGPKHLSIRVLEEDGTLHKEPVAVFVGGTEDGHYVLRYTNRLEDNEYHFAGIATDALDVSASTFAGDDIASKQVSLAGRDSLEVDLVIESAPLRVRVVDPDGEPLPAVRVRVRALDENRVLVVNNTSTDGWVSLPGVPREACLVDAMHDSGMMLAVPIDASLREQELVLEPTGSLTLALKDGDVALAGVTTRVQTPDGTSLATPLDTDAEGTARRDGLGEGSYYIACSRADCWPTSVRRTLAAGEQATLEVPMRRLAKAELLVLGPEGLPTPGVTAVLTSLEFKNEVSEWLTQGRVEAPTGLTTNPSGRILVDGLPNGLYGWSIALESGTSAGSFTLAPGENVRTLQLR
jgi:protocatechuate 3,4-dioxygenase beta subunit